jgi:hypothetical protein
LQHISKLSDYILAVKTCASLVKPGGYLAIHVNCEDFQSEDLRQTHKTLNFETFSEHFSLDSTGAYVHKQNSWSGVYIGHAQLVDILVEMGIKLETHYRHSSKKRGIWYIGQKML